MFIPVTSAVGRGHTELSAFDAALVTAGIADRNLIYLSSVVPPGSVVKQVDRIEETPGDRGDRLYCVVAECRTSVPGAQVWSGVGWMQDEAGRGLFVEHHAGDEDTLRALIGESLEGLCRNRALTFPAPRMEVAGARCTGDAVCALVVAAFEAAPWSGRHLALVGAERTGSG